MSLNPTSEPLEGREWLLAELLEWHHSGQPRATLVGPPGIGKSHLGRVLVDRIPNSVLIDFSMTRDPFETLHAVATTGPDGQLPSLLVIDALESAPAALWRSYGLDQDFPDVPKLFCFRPGVHNEGLQRPGTRIFGLDPADPRHQVDLENHLRQHGLDHLVGLVSTFQEAQFLIANPEQGAMQLDSYYLALWRESTRAFQGQTRQLVEQVALLLADTPEGLPFETVSDFTGLPLVAVREAIDLLAPILTMTPSGVTLFSRGLSLWIARHFSRDLGRVHGRIVSFFRETYPSWQEMHDPYGWRYLVLHCDRLARASRRQDFSVLHWLNEGSFSQLKLERTGMLPSVLKDLRLSLLASLETEDIPRVVSFGSRLARLRKHESVKTVHRLADSGNLPLARENAFLVSGEGQRLLLWLLFATQTLENGDQLATIRVLDEALTLPSAALDEIEVRLAGSLLAAMLSHPQLSPELEAQLLDVLSMGDLAEPACLAFKTAGQSPQLNLEARRDLLRRAEEYAHKIADEDRRAASQRELATRLARLTGEPAEPGVAWPDRLLQAKDRDKELARMLAEIPKGRTSLAACAAALIPIDDEAWSSAAFAQLTELLHGIGDQEVLRHSLSGLLQSLEDSTLKEVDSRILDTLSLAILSFDKPQDRSRFLARFAVMLSVKGRPLEAQQRVSLAAANAFSIADTGSRSEALLFMAGLVAGIGPVGRARDLTYHAIELRARVEELDRECRQLVRLLSTSSAKNDSAEEIVRLGENLRFDNSPPELEAKGRALVALAAGLARLGAEGQARSYREKAVETTRAIENLELRIHLLCDLAGALYHSGEKRQARKLAKEARTLFEETESDRGLQAATGLLRVAMVLENRTQTRKGFDTCLKALQSDTSLSWLESPALLDLLSLSRALGRNQELMEYLTRARQSETLRDAQRLGLLRCELELGDFAAAESLLDTLRSWDARCHAGIDLALALLTWDPDRALEHLSLIPLESARCEGIRRLALLNSAEIRPTEQARVRHVLHRLTLMAIDHPDAMDSVLSRWIQGCPDRETILAIADKMGWTTGATGLFREAMQTVQAAGGLIPEAASEDPAPEPPVETAAEPPQEATEDQGFRAISLTKPRHDAE